MDAGLRPMAARIEARQALFAWTLLHKREDPLVKSARAELNLLAEDKWAADIRRIEGKIGPLADFVSRKALQDALTDMTVQSILDKKSSHSTMRAASQPRKWFVLQKHVNDSQASKALCRARAGAMDIGNCFKNSYGMKYEYCPACVRLGRQVELWEGHVVFSCPVVQNLRRMSGILGYKRGAESRGVWEEAIILRKYLGDDETDPSEPLKRGSKVKKLVDAWTLAVHE